MPQILLQESGKDDSKRIPLFKNITRIGKDNGCDIVLSQDEIADNHANILKEQGSYFIAIMGRNRPTMLNGKRIKRERLSHGDVIEISQYSLVFLEQHTVTDNSENLVAELEVYRKIVSFSEELLQSKDLDSLLERMIDMVVSLTKADKAFLVLFEEGSPQIKVARNVHKETILDANAQLSDTIIEQVVNEQQPLIVEDALNHTQFKAAASVMNLHLNSVMCVPLKEEGQLIGILYVGSNSVVNLFQQKHLEVLTVFAAHASLLIQNAIQKDTLILNNQELKQQLDTQRFGEIIGSCDAMESIYTTIRKVAPTDVSVLITGETGTGKELIAREIHSRSTRIDQPFVVINCGAIPENLLESELFGHVKGAFTGAVATKPGKFQQAHGGTLFLDEIGEMPTALQVKLLRAIQDKNVTKVGSTSPEDVDIRIIAATNKELEKEISNNNFREDLYYRLNVVSVHLPALRNRSNDIIVLARYFLGKYIQEYKSNVKDFSPQAAVTINKYHWPGNIRQLENRIKKAVILAEKSHITPEDLDLDPDNVSPVLSLAQAKEQFQRTYINEVLTRNNGNRTKTAKDLGVDPRTIFRHLEKEESEQLEE